MQKKKNDKNEQLQIIEINQETLVFRVLGTTPIILNRFSEKARRELLLPSPPKTSATRAQSLKHNPMTEFRGAPYVTSDPKSPTYLQVLAAYFQKGMCGAALDLPDTNKSQIERLLRVGGPPRIAVYGIPYMRMDMTRCRDMNRTPDVRTRCCLKEWACEVEVCYAVPILNKTSVANLFAAAGIFQGAGDWRPGKGGSHGQYRFVDKGDKDWARIVKTGGRAAQIKAMSNPDFYDDDTEELYNWFVNEVNARGKADLLNTPAACEEEETEA